ncbi:MAG: hypothetical protein CMM16_05445 [Rhodospirillaceae bacterium]|nr:hypothetical protein [Rhodospirillaceae bacterium]
MALWRKRDHIAGTRLNIFIIDASTSRLLESDHMEDIIFDFLQATIRQASRVLHQISEQSDRLHWIVAGQDASFR